MWNWMETNTKLSLTNDKWTVPTYYLNGQYLKVCNNFTNTTRLKPNVDGPFNLLPTWTKNTARWPTVVKLYKKCRDFLFAKDMNTVLKVTVNHCKIHSKHQTHYYQYWTTNTVANICQFYDTQTSQGSTLLEHETMLLGKMFPATQSHIPEDLIPPVTPMRPPHVSQETNRCNSPTACTVRYESSSAFIKTVIQ
jgi:hypothetical protein